MNEKTFELMTAMYSEMQKGFNQMNERFEGLEEQVESNAASIRKIDMRIENEVMPKIDMLFDAVNMNGERIQRVEDKVDRLTDRVDSQEFDIRLIKTQRAE